MYQKELTFMEAVKKVYLKNYCNFSGRASRSEFWWAFLAQYALSMIFSCFLYILMIIVMVVTDTVSDSDPLAMVGAMMIVFIPMLIFALALFLPMLGVTVRRLHDTGRSGWYYLISLIPIVGFILYYWLALPSDMCENEYGPVPNVEPQPWDNFTTPMPPTQF